MYKIKQFFTKNIKNFSGDREFLSPHFEYPIVYEGITFPTAWHAYQASRCEDNADKIRMRDAKTIGDMEKIIDDLYRRWRNTVWDKAWLNMKDIQRIKFEAKKMKQMLLNTYPAKIIFGNKDHQHFWGICFAHLFATGQNALGKMLMNLRDEFMSQGTDAVRGISKQ